MQRKRSEPSGSSQKTQSLTNQTVLHKLKQIIEVASNEILQDPIKPQKPSSNNNLDRNVTIKQQRTVFRTGNKKSNGASSVSTPNLADRTKNDISNLYLSQSKVWSKNLAQNNLKNRKDNLRQNLSDANLKKGRDVKKRNVTFLVNSKVLNKHEMGDFKKGEKLNQNESINKKVEDDKVEVQKVEDDKVEVEKTVVEKVAEIEVEQVEKIEVEQVEKMVEENINSDKKIEENSNLENLDFDFKMYNQPSLNEEIETESITITLDSLPICKLTSDPLPKGQFGPVELVKKVRAKFHQLLNFINFFP